MAFLPQNPDDKENQANGSQNQIPLIPTLAGAGGDATASAGSSSGKTNTANSPGAAPSAPWANISSYLSANAPQSKQTADTIAGNFNKSYQDIQNQTAGAEKNFNDSISQNTIGLDSNLFNQAKSNPTDFAKDPNNVAAFQKAYNGSYTGPQNFESSPDYANIQSSIQKGQTNANLLNQGTSGIESLLSNIGHNPTPGQNALDTLLLQENPTNYQTINKAAAPFSGLNDYLSGKVTNLDQSAQNAAKTSDQNRNTLQQAFTGDGGVIPTFQSGVNDRYNQFLNSSKTNLSTLQNDLSKGNLSAEEIQQLGLDPTQARAFIDSYAKLPAGSNINPLNYLTDKTGTLTPESFASSNDYAEAQALNQLTGQDMGWLNSQNAGLAGTAPQNPFSFDAGGATKSISDYLASLPTAPPPALPEPTPTDSKLVQTVGGDVGNKLNDYVVEHPLKAIAAPITVPIDALKGVYDTVKNINTDGLNPFSGGGDDSKNAGVDSGALAGSVASNFNKYLPAQYQIDPGKVGQSKDVLSMIPPQGAIPDTLRNSLIQNIFAGLPAGAMTSQTPDMQTQLATAIRSNPNAATADQTAFLQNYDKAHPQTTTTRQNVVDAIDKDKAQAKTTGKPSGVLGTGSKTSGVF